MMIVTFQTLIPNSVKNWILEKYEKEEGLENAKIRLFNKLSNSNTQSYFYTNGKVEDVEEENKEWIGNCKINLNANSEEEAKIEFKSIFGDMAKKGQKFRFVSFKKVD